MYQIINHFYTVQQVEALPDYNPEGNTNGTIVDVDFSVELNDEKEKVWLALQGIQSNQQESQNQPYQFDFVSLCYFKINPEVENSDEDTVKAAVFDMMAGATRERLISLSSRGPWQKFSLQPVPTTKMGPDSTTTEPSSK